MVNVKTTLVQSQNTAFPANASTWKWSLATSSGGFAIAAAQYLISRPGGVYSNLRARVVTNTNNNTCTVRFSNNGSNSNLVIAVTTTATGSFEDVSNSDTVVVATNCFMHLTVPNGSTGSITFSLTQIDFLASSDTHTALANHGSATLSAASTTCYNPITSTIATTVTTESQAQTQFSHSCTLKNFRIFVSTDARSTNTTHRIRKNGANGNQSIATTTTGIFEDTSTTDTVVSGDKICISTTTSTGTGNHIWTNSGFDVENTTNSSYPLISSAFGTGQNSALTRFESGGHHLATATEANTQVKLYKAATLKNLTVNISANTLNGTTTIRLRKNAADANPVVSITTTQTGFFTDTTNTTQTATGDLVNFSIVTAGSSGTITYRSLYVEVAPDYDITKQLTLKNSILQEITKQLTTKFTILESLTAITKQLTIKLNILQEITKTNTLKVSILQAITKQLTTKLNILEAITKTLTTKVNILQAITKQLTTKVSIQQEITKQLTTKFSILTPITKQLTTKLNILQEIIKQLTTRLDIIGRITETQTHKYNIIGKITTTKTHKYNVLVAITATKNHLYNVIGKVTRLRTHKYNVIQAITETNTHKYNIIGKITRTRTHKYNIIEQIEANKTHKYNVTAPEGTVSRTRTHKYNVDGRVSTTKTHLYNVLDSITLSTTHKYHVLDQALTTKTHKYNVIGRLYTTKTHKYNVIRRITATKNHLYDILEGASEVTKNTTHVYNVLVRITNTLTHKYNVIGKITRLRTHKYNITGRIYKNGTYKFNIIQKITRTRTHIYNLLNRVTPDRTRTHKYNVLGKITRLRTHKYNIIGRIYRTRTHKYHMGGKLTITRIHKFDVGSATGLQELGGSTNAYIRFPERVKIIDIVSNIENIVVANIEIIVSRPPANKAIGLVVIAEYSSRLLTAESTRLKHKTISLQILPPIIETIEQKAIAPHIAVEILPLLDKPQLQIQGRLQLANNRDKIHLQSLTQMKQDIKTKIKIASAILLEQTRQTVIGSDSYVEIPTIPTPVVAPEIMTKHKAKTLKTLINLLSSDHLFE